MASAEENPSRSIKYLKSRGTSPQKGIYYEQEVTASISLLALNCDEFSLISNPPSCAPFDDIILCTRRANRNVIYLFQVKLRNEKALEDQEFRDETVRNKKRRQQQSKLSIVTLYKKYLKSKKSIQDVIPPFYTEECTFKIIIFTDTPIQENSEIFEVESDDSMFTTNFGKFYKFNRTFIEINLSKADEDFLQIINVFAEQNSPSKASIPYIAESFKTEYNIAQKINSLYFKYIKNWCEIETEKECLTKDFVRKLLFHSAFKQFEVPINNFIEADFEKYKDIFLKSQNWGDRNNEECLELLWKLIKNDKLVISHHHIQYVLGKAFEDLEDFNRQIDSDESYYKQIISGDDLNPPSQKQLQYYIGCLLDKLPYLVKNCGLAVTDHFKNAKIVFIEAIGTKHRQHFLEINEHVLNILQPIKITTEFGQSFNLGNIIKDNSNYTTISEVFNLIINAYNNKIHKKEILINMRLNKVLLDEKIFLEENIGHLENDVFIITGHPPNIFNNCFILKDRNCEYFLEQTEEDLKPFSIGTVNNGQCKVKFSRKNKYIFLENENIKINTQNSGNFHFIRFVFLGHSTLFQIQWLRTNGKITNINKFRSHQTCEVIQKELSNSVNYVYSCNCCLKLKQVINYLQNNNLLVISGVPGIGKTTTLKHFARTAATNDFIIYVALSNHYQYFKNYEKNVTKSDAKDHIHYFYNNKNPILNSFFAKKLENNEIIILLDGFNEIAPQYTKAVSEIINQIKMQNYKIILSTRSVLKNKTEGLFDTLCLTLTPLNVEERRRINKIYFNKLGKDIDYLNFCNQVESNIRSNLELFNVPLNLHLFLENFVSEIKSLNDLPKNYNLNQLQLYENFINLRFKIYSKLHKNINKAFIEKYHKYFSIKKIFCNVAELNVIKDILDIKLDDYITRLQIGDENVGILINDVDEVFIHRTVAEYFSAKWLYDIFVINDNNLQIITKENEFAKSIMKIINLSLPHTAYDDNKMVKFSMVRHFFNLMINQIELHEAAFDGNYKNIKQILNDDITKVTTLNNFRRNLLHTIILNNSYKDFYLHGFILEVNEDWVFVIKLLLKHVKNILTQKDFSQISVQDFIQQKVVVKDGFKVLIYNSKYLNCYVIYYNRPFQLWELFRSENLYNCQIDQLLEILQIDQTKVSSIFSAVKDQNCDVIQQFLQSGTNVNILDEHKLHLYHIAAAEGCLAIIQLLDRYGMQENKKILDKANRSLVHYAVVGGNLQLIHNLENQFDLNSCDVHGLTPFHYAIIFNKIHVVQYFLEHNVHDVSFPNKFNYLPNHYAVAFGNKKIFETLLKKDCFSTNKEKPIHLICFINCYINDMIDSLILNETKTEKEKQTLLNKQYIYNERCFAFVKILFKKGWNINSESEEGNITPFIIAVKFGNKKLVEYLIANFADITNKINEFALHIAASNCDIEMLKLLLKHFKIDALDKDMNSVLHYTFCKDNKNYYEVADYLIKNGVRPYFANNEGITPLHLAIGKGQFKTIKLLIGYTNVNVQTNEGNTPLHYAALFQRFDTVQYLIEQRPQINLTNKKNQTSLDLAYREDYKDLNIILCLEANNAITLNKNVHEYGRPHYSFRFLYRIKNYLRRLYYHFGYGSVFYQHYIDSLPNIDNVHL